MTLAVPGIHQRQDHSLSQTSGIPLRLITNSELQWLLDRPAGHYIYSGNKGAHLFQHHKFFKYLITESEKNWFLCNPMYFVLYEEKYYSEKGPLGFTQRPKCSQGIRFLPREGQRPAEGLSMGFVGCRLRVSKSPGGGRRLWSYRGVPRASEGMAFSNHCSGPSGGDSTPGASRTLPDSPIHPPTAPPRAALLTQRSLVAWPKATPGRLPKGLQKVSACVHRENKCSFCHCVI